MVYLLWFLAYSNLFIFNFCPYIQGLYKYKTNIKLFIQERRQSQTKLTTCLTSTHNVNIKKLTWVLYVELINEKQSINFSFLK